MSNTKKKLAQIQRDQKLLLRDMTPTKRERFLANTRTLIQQGEHARRLNQSCERGRG